MSGKKGQKGTKPTDVESKFESSFIDGLDGRVRLVRTLRERFSGLTRDLGGQTNLSYQEQSLCKRAVHLERLLELKEATLARGGTCDEGIYLNGINALSGLFGKLGLKRRTKPVIDIARHFQEVNDRKDPTPNTTP